MNSYLLKKKKTNEICKTHTHTHTHVLPSSPVGGGGVRPPWRFQTKRRSDSQQTQRIGLEEYSRLVNFCPKVNNWPSHPVIKAKYQFSRKSRFFFREMCREIPEFAKSTVSRKNCLTLFPLWRYSSVTWHDPVFFFLPKAAQRTPHKVLVRTVAFR